MRAYFKNDLYNFTAQRDKERQAKKREEQQRQVLEKKSKVQQKKREERKKQNDDKQDERTISKPIIKVDDNLHINIDDMKKDNKTSSTEEMQAIDELLKSVSKKKSGNQQNKNIFSNGYKPKSNLVVKEEIKEPKSQKQERKQRISQYVSYKKIENQIRKNAKEEEEANKQGEKEKKDEVESAGQQSKQASPKKGRTKMIKKQANYQRLDLKRKYKDRFLGALHNNLRKYTRNGRLRPKYRAQSELTMQDGQLYNSYISSLSSALVMTLNIQDDSEDDNSSSSGPNQWITPEQLNKESLTACIQKYFGFQAFRQGQYQTIQNIINGRSTIFISQTASGKSLTYILSSMILKGLSIVISPLVSLMLDQLAHLPKELPAACISSLINRQQKQRIITMVKQGKINLLFLTPQCLQTDFIFHLQDFPQANFTCIDQAHSLSELSHNFRTSFLALGDIVLNMIKYKNNKPTILGLTATANPETVESIKQKLDIKQTIRSSNCMNKNLFVTISREKGALKYQSLIRYLNDPLICLCKGILVYTRTRKIMSQVFNYITNSVSSPAAIYHSALSNKEKTQTLKKFREGSIKIVVATVALGMGLDFSNLQCVVHLNMPKSIENYVQQIGRAGRRERRAYCHLFLDENDYITERNYIIADQIQPSLLQLVYDYLMENSTFKQVKKAKQKISKENERLAQEQVIKRATIIMEQCQREEQIIYQEDEEQLDSDQSANQVVQVELKKVNTRLFSVRVEKLKEKTQLREEAILTLLLKIQSLLKNDSEVRLKVMPVSNQLIKIGFFKQNQQEIKSSQPFFKSLIYGCKKVKGTIYINLIEKCNELYLKPIQLLTQLYRISHKYAVKIELENPIFVWQFEGLKTDADGGIQEQLSQLVQRGFQKLMSRQCMNKVISQMNGVQSVSLVKLNVLWSLAFLHSRNHILNILQNGRLLPRSQPIPQEGISKQFDKYFKDNLQAFYDKITNGGTQIFIPTTMVDKKDIQELYGSIELFFRHELANQGQLCNQAEVRQARRRVVQKYHDGKILTKILMGVNSGEVSWKIYGQRKYWMHFKLKNYSELLQAVREGFERYKQHYFGDT